MTHNTARSIGYEIRVRDHLETYWHAWFDSWTVTNLENGEVLLSKLGVDQSALHGALNKIRDLNLTLIAVRRISEKETLSIVDRPSSEGRANPERIDWRDK